MGMKMTENIIENWTDAMNIERRTSIGITTNVTTISRKTRSISPRSGPNVQNGLGKPQEREIPPLCGTAELIEC